MIFYKDNSVVDYHPDGLKSFRIAWLFPHFDIASDPAYRLRRYLVSGDLSRVHILDPIKSTNNVNIVSTNVVSGEKVFYPGKAYNDTSYLKKCPNFVDYLTENFDAIVFFNVDEEDSVLCKTLSERGKICIFDHSENIFGLGFEDAIMRSSSAITCCSVRLAENTDIYLKNKGMDKKIFIIRDPIERGVEVKSSFKKEFYRRQRGTNRAIIMGGVGPVSSVSDFLYDICKKANYDFVALSDIKYEAPYETHQWTPYSWVDTMLNCDVALCAQDVNRFPAKSNVKATTAMSIGLPVIASSTMAYQEAIKHGKTGFIASTEEEWVSCLEKLKDPWVRTSIGNEGMYSAHFQYSLRKIIDLYINMISGLMEE